MAKAFDDEINDQLRALARRVMREHAEDKQSLLAELLDVSPAFVSDFLNGKRGAGLETLSGLGRFAPLELLSILGIPPGVVVTLVEGSLNQLEDGLASLPSELRRAARAAIELTGCTPGEAGQAALAVFAEHGQRNDEEPDWWLLKIRSYLSARPKSGVFRSDDLLLPAKPGA
jgi:transcriptional regulator with XRE-family HTH domain